MRNIKSASKNYYLKMLLYLLIPILIFISTSKTVFSNDLNNNTNRRNAPEEELAIKYCDAINKKIFNGLNKEASLKYEYYFSSLKNKNYKDDEMFLKEFRLNVIKNCSYKLTQTDIKEFSSFIKKFLHQN